MIDRKERKVWLTEQLRYPTLAKGPGWMTEVPAGGIKDKETADDAARREAGEEIGLVPPKLERVASFYVSPGGASERIFLYFVEVGGAKRDEALAKRTRDPDEDIKFVEWNLDDFIGEARLGRLNDAKTLIAGLWLLANRERLKV
jgi:ADP-ribose pyrophosphatase